MNRRFLLALPLLLLTAPLFSQVSAQSTTDSLRPCFALDSLDGSVFCPAPRPKLIPWPYPVLPRPFPVPHPPICPDSWAGCQPLPIDLTR